jgi:hypothetical protein
MMRVSATVNGSPFNDSAQITVAPPRWGTFRISVSLQPGDGRDLPPAAEVDSANDLAHTHMVDVDRYEFASGTGPSAGWVFLRSQPVMPVVIHYNSSAFNYNSPWAELQTGGSWVDPSDGKIKPYCRRTDVDSLRVLTLAHEGYGPNPQYPSHVDAMRIFLSQSTMQDTLAPRAIAYRPETFRDQMAALLSSVVSAANNDPKNVNHTNDSIPGIVAPATFPCAARPWH